MLLSQYAIYPLGSFVYPNPHPPYTHTVLHECKKKYWYTADHMMSWSYQMALGLEFIHGKKMLHRDIKPSKYANY